MIAACRILRGTTRVSGPAHSLCCHASTDWITLWTRPIGGDRTNLAEDAISAQKNLIAPADAKLHGSAIIEAIKKSGVQTVVTVPDRTTASGLLQPISQDNELRHVLVSKEDEALAISAALSYCDHRALCLFQYTGLLDSINAVRGVAVEYDMPICMMVGLLGKEPGVAPTESNHYGVRIIEPILDAMGVAHVLVESDDDIEAIVPAIDEAYKNSCPIAILIGRPPIPPHKDGGGAP
jgi:sulfopyruvate decarboxylase TPP-binding subunit